MKKISMWKRIGMAVMATALVSMFASCGNPVTGSDDDGTGDNGTTIFDPALKDTYKVYKTYEDGSFSDELAEGTDYSIEDGLLKITPIGWDGAWIVLNEEVDCTGAKKATADLKAGKAGALKMGLNAMSSDASKNSCAGFVDDASTTVKTVESKFGKAFEGTDWSDGGAKYDGKEKVKMFQAYGQDTSDWSATEDVEIYVGKVVVFVPADGDKTKPVTKTLVEEASLTLNAEKLNYNSWDTIPEGKEVGDFKCIGYKSDAYDFSEEAKAISVPKGATIKISYERDAIDTDYVGHYIQMYGADGGDWDKWIPIKGWADTYPSKDAGTVSFKFDEFDEDVKANSVVFAQMTIGIQGGGGDDETVDTPITIKNLKVTAEWEE